MEGIQRLEKQEEINSACKAASPISACTDAWNSEAGISGCLNNPYNSLDGLFCAKKALKSLQKKFRENDFLFICCGKNFNCCDKNFNCCDKNFKCCGKNLKYCGKNFKCCGNNLNCFDTLMVRNWLACNRHAEGMKMKALFIKMVLIIFLCYLMQWLLCRSAVVRHCWGRHCAEFPSANPVCVFLFLRLLYWVRTRSTKAASTGLRIFLWFS